MPTKTINTRVLAGMLREFGIPEPTHEYVFHPTREWRFDLAWPDRKVALEVEGGIYGRGKPCPTCGQRRTGAHKSTSGILRDIEKYNEATLLGWRVLRVPHDKLLTSATGKMLLTVLT